MPKRVIMIGCILLNTFSAVQAQRRSIHMSTFASALQQFYAGKKVLVTGGCGFIGSHIAQSLVELGAEVTIIDNLITGREENIAAFRDKVTYINGSVTDEALCRTAAHDKDLIFHLAAFISVPQSMEKPLDCHHANVDGTVNLLEAARTEHVQRFIFSSSASVYGNTEEPCSELTPTNPQSPYAWSKLIGEQYCKQYADLFGVPTICMRYFNVYGDRQNPHAPYAAAVAKFKYHMERNESVTVFGDGMQTRDFVPVETVAETNLLLGMLPIENLNGDVYNVATGRSINLFELFDLIRPEYPAYNQPIKFAPARSGDVKHAVADCRKLERLKEKTSYAPMQQ